MASIGCGPAVCRAVRRIGLIMTPVEGEVIGSSGKTQCRPAGVLTKSAMSERNRSCRRSNAIAGQKSVGSSCAVRPYQYERTGESNQPAAQESPYLGKVTGDVRCAIAPGIRKKFEFPRCHRDLQLSCGHLELLPVAKTKVQFSVESTDRW